MTSERVAGTVVALSLYDEALREAERFKWIESEKQGRDLGEFALKQWFRKFWFDYCRHCRLEHIQGDRFWLEFGEENFGQLYTLVIEGNLLADRILDRVALGMENLEILIWARDWGLPIEDVIEILELLDINRARLEPCIA